MSIFKSIRLGMVHVAVTISFALITGVLNRVMIFELQILASLTALLVVLPYLFSPLQIWVGRLSDSHPIAGYHRTPYIALGMLLCLGGTLLTPQAAFALAAGVWYGLPLALLVFGVWGFGYNLAVVAYLALASDLATEAQRARTISIMWFMMIIAIIVTAVGVGRALEPFSYARLTIVFAVVCALALLFGVLGLVGIEQRDAAPVHSGRPVSFRALLANPSARWFFIYLIIMLSAILAQDVLLEPYGAEAFGMSVGETTRLTSVWGGATLVSLLLYGLLLNRVMSKRQGAALGGVLAALGLAAIGLSGVLEMRELFLPAITLLGLGTGIATSSNLALMLDMTLPQQAGMFIGAWGVADSVARGIGTLLGGIGRDTFALLSGDPILGYSIVFFVEALFLAASLLMLRRLDVATFRNARVQLSELMTAGSV